MHAGIHSLPWRCQTSLVVTTQVFSCPQRRQGPQRWRLCARGKQWGNFLVTSYFKKRKPLFCFLHPLLWFHIIFIFNCMEASGVEAAVLVQVLWSLPCSERHWSRLLTLRRLFFQNIQKCIIEYVKPLYKWACKHFFDEKFGSLIFCTNLIFSTNLQSGTCFKMFLFYFSFAKLFS